MILKSDVKRTSPDVAKISQNIGKFFRCENRGNFSSLIAQQWQGRNRCTAVAGVSSVCKKKVEVKRTSPDVAKSSQNIASFLDVKIGAISAL